MANVTAVLESPFPLAAGGAGDASSSLWGTGKATNNKLIGGDQLSSPSLPRGTNWLSADINVSRGYRGDMCLLITTVPSGTDRGIQEVGSKLLR